LPPKYLTWRKASPNPFPGQQHRTNPYDFAFLVMKPYKGHNVEDYTGALYPKIEVSAHNTPTTVAGYNSNSGNLSWCRNVANGVKYKGDWYVRVDCPQVALVAGTSGGPFIETNAYTVIGLMGGYEEGGDSAHVDYSSWFQADFVSAYENAQTG